MSRNKKKTSKRRTEGLDPLMVTILIAIAAPLVVLLYLVIVTSDASPRKLFLDKVKVLGSWSPDAEHAGVFRLGPKPTLIVVELPPDTPRGRLTFDFFLKEPVLPQLELRCGMKADLPNLSHRINLVNQLRQIGRNEIVVSFDDLPGSFVAEVFMISIASSQKANMAGVRNIEIESFSFSQRFTQAWSRIFERQPLILSTINLVFANRFVGRSVLFIFWAGFAVTIVIFLWRRYALNRSLPLFVHASVTVMVLVVLADLRNFTDYGQNAWLTARNWAKAETIYDQLDSELVQLEWSTPAIEFLREKVAAKQKYYLKVDPQQWHVLSASVLQMRYYALPVRWTDKLDEADFALLLQQSPQQLLESGAWKQIETLPGDMVVLERKQ